MIEKGRHLRLEQEKRLCPLGCNVVEDEKHFFMQCTHLKSIRIKYWDELRSIGSLQHGNMTDVNAIFVNILKSSDSETIKKTAVFIRDAMSVREGLLNHQVS